MTRLKTLLKAASEPYPDFRAMSDIGADDFSSIADAHLTRQLVRYSKGVCSRTLLKRKANADLDMPAVRARTSTVQSSAGSAWIASMTGLRRGSDIAASQPRLGLPSSSTYARSAWMKRSSNSREIAASAPRAGAFSHLRAKRQTLSCYFN